jgi:hypothetical protein
MENLHTDLIESLTEYDLDHILNAFIRLYGRDAIAQLLEQVKAVFED